ncbi:uncharacterized protein Bfra_011238 [Botrytis fragariae]|uniref:Uncharacterized protein n=1 Tax=Botrytis fragariae TaxID=1964551 RepID=A0A8H6EEL0_9HELO|nr:uncharacterized protein Bfra_011238 [Botrytis fragariae]KAF5869432.1 hypothetical protein Bfra_011238 [Botrytis fragariae]
MSTTNTKSPDGRAFNQTDYTPSFSTDEPNNGRRATTGINTNPLPNPPTSEGLRAPAGNLLKGATEVDGSLKSAAVMVSIKLDLEAEVHLTARIRGDIVIGLY